MTPSALTAKALPYCPAVTTCIFDTRDPDLLRIVQLELQNVALKT
jgi:hypothetical protein